MHTTNAAAGTRNPNGADGGSAGLPRLPWPASFICNAPPPAAWSSGLITAGLIDRRTHPASRRELVVELTGQGQEVVQAVTEHRREEIARVVDNMPERERYGLVSALTAFTTAGSEPPARLEIDGYLV